MATLNTAVTQKPKKKMSASAKALWWGIFASFAFTALTWALGPFLPQINFLPDTGYDWYYWKLPEPTVMSRVTAWSGYLLHQLVVWGIIYYAQKNKTKYTSGLHRVNILSFAANGIFILLHLLQTHIWYDGLAQDTHIMSSQGSVVVLLIAVLLMENQRRGLIFGKGKRLNFLNDTGRVVRKYHGYYFAWAIIYTFWYHPMETTSGHLLGLVYTFLIMLQGSLMYTRIHVNKWWTLAQEMIVVVHGTLVAINQNNGIWPMFFFGFLALFIVTQMHGLGLKQWQKWGFVIAYAAAAIIVYSSRGWGMLNEIVRIPVIDYLGVFVLALLIWLGMRVGGFVTARLRSAQAR
ncbi:MAG: hypothetical protein KC443_17285 [Anaerolineales bacterium]|nr:hypothetical protein [Anaerolineales bacterium]